MAALKMKEYTFFFDGGGWNTEWAKTRPQAYKQACKRFPDLADKIIKDSFHIAKDDERKMLLALFY